ncbi:MAG TPA: hypothetical protein VHX17_11520 [Candidatus Cybelea sp.]|nr:hypothetical protein [Candidatus Cybelea sp.]
MARIGIALIAAGTLLRAALYFPLALFQIDSDGTLAGLCAFRVAAGAYPLFFPGGTRLSAASCYVAAAYFHVLGDGRVGLALTGLTWGILYLVFSWLFLRALLGDRLGCVAMIFAVIPPEQFMTVTYVPWAYGEIMASCAATLWLATLWRQDGATWQRFAFGLSAGLGIWLSLQTLMVSLPALVWIGWKRRTAMLREVPVALAGFVVGALPFAIGNIANGAASLTHNWASQAAPNGAIVFDNVIWFATTQVPKLLFHEPAGWWSLSTPLILGYAAIAAAFIVALNRNRKYADAWQLIWLVSAGVFLFYVASQAGSMRGWTVRYIAPLYLTVPVAGAIGAATLWRFQKWLAIAAVLLVTVPNFWLYSLPGTQTRIALTQGLHDDARLRSLLVQRGVRMIYGDYFWVYHINFDSGERIAGVPSWEGGDYFHYDRQLGQSEVRWALLGGHDEVLGWAKAVGARGTIVPDGDLWAFIADRPAHAAALIASLRRLFH